LKAFRLNLDSNRQCRTVDNSTR